MARGDLEFLHFLDFLFYIRLCLYSAENYKYRRHHLKLLQHSWIISFGNPTPWHLHNYGFSNRISTDQLLIVFGNIIRVCGDHCPQCSICCLGNG